MKAGIDVDNKCARACSKQAAKMKVIRLRTLTPQGFGICQLRRLSRRGSICDLFVNAN
jgi:endonuclease V-like protein UPF0215 family